MVAAAPGAATPPEGGPETASRALRDAFGRFATGVTVVTASANGAPVGITANSFSSVSLEPPLVLWCPAKSSSRFEAFAAARHFAIHVLAAGQDALMHRFVRDGRDFSGLDATENPEGVPVFEGCPARFDCALHALHDAGDHAIAVGRVLRYKTAPGAPMIFARGRYGGFTGAL